MPIHVACDHCRSTLQVLDEHAGRQVRCPKCYQVFVARAASAPAPAVPPPAASGPGGSCASCGAPVVGPAAFCTSCGKSVKGPGEVPVSVSSPSPAAWSPAPPPAPYPGERPKCGTATAALICGILALPCALGPLLAIPAIICGHMAKSQIAASGGVLDGDQHATWGLILGYFNLLLGCGLVGLFVAANA